MKETIAFAPLVLALACAGCASPVHDEIVVRAYDGPPPPQTLYETLTAICDGRLTELRFVRSGWEGAPGRVELYVRGHKIADLSDTLMGKDWTARSRVLNKTMVCQRNFIRMAAWGVEIQRDGTGRLIYSEASLNDGKVTHYLPPQEKDPDYWRPYTE